MDFSQEFFISQIFDFNFRIMKKKTYFEKNLRIQEQKVLILILGPNF